MAQGIETVNALQNEDVSTDLMGDARAQQVEIVLADDWRDIGELPRVLAQESDEVFRFHYHIRIVDFSGHAHDWVRRLLEDPILLDCHRVIDVLSPEDYETLSADSVDVCLVEDARAKVGHFTSWQCRQDRLSFSNYLKLRKEFVFVLKALEVALKQGPSSQECKFLLEQFRDGYHALVKTGQTPELDYKAMRKLFDVTNGAFNDYFLEIMQRSHPVVEAAQFDDSIGLVDSREYHSALSNLKEEGVFIFENKVDQQLCQQLYDFARTAPCVPYGNTTAVIRQIYDPANPQSLRYNFGEYDVIKRPEVQRIATDPSLLSLVQAHFGCEPILDIAIMWWSTAFQTDDNELSVAAQKYHYDMSTPNFLKVFVYLTDVNEESGPHCYVKKSHGQRPLLMLRDGRPPDEKVERLYGRDAITEVTGPRGTLFVADTRGIHKGKALKKGHRLVLQLEYTSCVYGDVKQKRLNIEKDACTTQFLQARKHYPRIFSRFEVDDCG